MHNYGQAFRTIRLIRNLSLEQVADALSIDERSLRDIESGKTKVVSERSQQMTKFYNVEPELVFELAAGRATFQNIIHDAKRDAIVVNQGQAPEKDIQEKYVAALEKRIDEMEARIRHLENNEAFLKDLIAKKLS